MIDAKPDETAVRTALWRALHVLVDPPPHVLTDQVGLRLAAPDAGWRDRGDMHPQGTAAFRASIVARARFVEDLVVERRPDQYVLLGAGLDSFAQRYAEPGMTVFEVDQPEPQAWKRRRLAEEGYGVPERLRLVPVDFEGGESWWEELVEAGFDATRSALVASTGVSMYLSREAIVATLRQVATLAPGSTLAMTFMLPPELLDEAERGPYQAVLQAAAGSGTPFRSLFPPAEIVTMALDAGFADARHVAGSVLADRYFAGRPDGLHPGDAEAILVATT